MVPEVDGRVQVPWGSADDCRQNPELLGCSAALGYELIE